MNGVDADAVNDDDRRNDERSEWSVGEEDSDIG